MAIQTGLFGTETTMPDPVAAPRPEPRPVRPLLDTVFHGIDPEVLACVDLSVAHSPVIVCRGEGLRHAVPAARCGDGRYMVRHPLLLPRAYMVGEEELRIMRCRYLLARDAHYGPQVRAHFERTRPAPADEPTPPAEG